MGKRLIEKAIEKNAEQLEYEEKLHEIVKDCYIKAENDETKKQELEDLNFKISKLEQKIEKSSKTRKKVGLSILGFSGICVLITVVGLLTSLFSLAGVAGVSALVSFYSSLICFSIDKEIQTTQEEKKDKLESKRAELLSNYCFSVSTEVSNNVCKEIQKERTVQSEIEVQDTTENNLTV